MMRSITNSLWFKSFAAWVALMTVVQLWFPTAAFALTAGPSQPEMNGFQPIELTNMVDPFSGDFSYNIPLLNVPGVDGGYPINIGYQSGTGMEQEASWVGLNWILNPGAINRQLRGIPDDFKGDEVVKEMSLKPDNTYSVQVGASNSELLGLDLQKAGESGIGLGLNADYQLYYNTYSGIGTKIGLGFSLTMLENSESNGLGLSGQLSMDSKTGMSVTPSLSYSRQISQLGNKFSLGATYHSRQGLQNIHLGHDFSFGKKIKDENGKTEKIGKHKTLGGWAGSGVTFSRAAGMPTIDFPRKSSAYSMATKVGASTTGLTFDLDVDVAYQTSQLSTNSITMDGYGYLYAQDAPSNTDLVMMDFSKELTGPLTKHSVVIPMANHNYDVWHVKGQGVGGNFRPYRSDYGSLRDPAFSENSINAAGGFNIDPGAETQKFGGDVKFWASDTYAGPWSGGKSAVNQVQFKTNDIDGSDSDGNVSDSEFEPVYFKNSGDLTANVMPASRAFDDDAQRIGLRNENKLPVAKAYFLDASGANQSIGQEYRDERDIRVNSFNYQTRGEVSGLSNTLAGNDISHHIGQVTVLDAQGKQYVYGQPVYNHLQEEYMFSVEHDYSTQTTTTGDRAIRTSYTATERSLSNESGNDHLFTRSITPPYAHSYLLTACLSHDYVDADGTAGPSEGDFGGYTKFNYSEHLDDYQWRIPFEADQANFDIGKMSDLTDDKASFSYGKKEIHYLESVETKTHIAVFHTSDREDGLEVTDVDGGKNSSSTRRLQKLDKISLYSKAEYLDANGNPIAGAKPIKEVHFEYDYSLCSGIPNNSGTAVDKNGGNPNQTSLPNVNVDLGKLTLKKVWFTFRGLDSKTMLSPYEFTYEESAAQNPDYQFNQCDRWGNYQADNPAGTPSLINMENPYTNNDWDFNGDDNYTNDEAPRNDAASAWNLRKITLPSGGEIEIEYEADDYAYVQHKRAMQMCLITGTGNINGKNSGNQAGNLQAGDTRLYFQLPYPIKDDASATDNLAKYFSGVGTTFFKTWLRLKKPVSDVSNMTNNEFAFDYVDGYLEVDNATYGFNSSATTEIDSETYFTEGWIDVETVDISDKGASAGQCSPIRKAGLQYLRMQRQDLFQRPNTAAGNITNAAMAVNPIVEFIPDLIEAGNFILGYYKMAIQRGYCKKIDVSESNRKPSYIRLNNPEGHKYGGGSRVKKIVLYDRWEEISPFSNLEEFKYGQEFSYELPDGRSSGVAEYEPITGGEENPFKMPIRYSSDRMLVRDQALYLETPLGESYYPGASVGYSRVLVRNLERTVESAILTKSDVGTTVHEFHTAKDYPTRARRTKLDKVKHSPPRISIPFIGGVTTESRGYSQGFIVELNNMHGKAKRTASYAVGALDQDQGPVTETRYTYHTTGDYKEGKLNRLSNNVKVVLQDGTTDYMDLGKEVEIFSYFNEGKTLVETQGAEFNFTVGSAGFPFIPLMVPPLDRSESFVRTLSTTKVINRSAILEKTESSYEGSLSVTENLAFDPYTGQAVETRTTNEFMLNVYSNAYPAHWQYDRMRGAYENIRMKINAGNKNLLRPGDELVDASGNHYWVGDYNTSTSAYDVFDDQDQAATLPTAGTGHWTIIRSGNRNHIGMMMGGRSSHRSGLDQSLPFFEAYNALADDITFPYASGGEGTDFGFMECSSDQYEGVDVSIGSHQFGGSNSVLHFETASQGCALDIYFYEEISDISNFNEYDLEYTGEAYSDTKNGATISGIKVTASNGTNSYTAILANESPADCFTQCNTDDVLTISANVFEHDWTYDYVDAHAPITASVANSNPYRYGAKGIWRNQYSYTYQEDRKQLGTGPDFDSYIGTDGHFSAQAFDWETLSNNPLWTKATEVTMYSPYGYELENQDVLGVASSALYGYDNVLPMAVGQNVGYYEFGFDGFEDYGATSYAAAPIHGHLKFDDNSNDGTIETDEAHTGTHSLKIAAGQSILLNSGTGSSSFEDAEWRPIPYSNYTLTLWVKGDGAKVTIDPSFGTQLFEAEVDPTQTPIEGWYRLDIPHPGPDMSESYSIEIEAQQSAIYIDDVVLRPSASTVKSFVYDPNTLWLMAELDDRNYATFYNYDEEGQIVQIKKETARGVETIQMTRSNTQHPTP